MRWQAAILVVAAGIVFGVMGCTKENSVTVPSAMTDQQALQLAVASTDSVADFSSSDEATIDDNGLENPEYDVSSAAGGGIPDHMGMVLGVPVTPVRWGRHIFWNRVTRAYDVVIQPGDSVALVAITKTIPGEFWVAVGQRTPDTVVVDSVIKKPFTEVVKRNVRFIRIARSDTPLRNWVPVAITMVAGKTKPDSLNHFAIASLEVENVGHFDTTVTDPLDTWFRLGLFRGSVPRFRAGDSIRVTVTVNSSSDSAELSFLRHDIAGGGPDHRRSIMRLVSTTGGAGNFTRVYERSFIARFPPFLPLGVRAGRFNAVIDVISHGSIFTSDDPFTNEFWGSPYLLLR